MELSDWHRGGVTGRQVWGLLVGTPDPAARRRLGPGHGNGRLGLECGFKLAAPQTPPNGVQPLGYSMPFIGRAAPITSPEQAGERLPQCPQPPPLSVPGGSGPFKTYGGP